MDVFEMGSSVPEKEIAVKKKKKKRLFLIFGSVGLVLFIAGFILWNLPKLVVARSLANAAEDLAERDEFAPVLEMLDGGSLEINAKGKDFSIDGKLYTNIDDYRIFLEDLTLTADGKTAAASIYASPESIWVDNGKSSSLYFTPGQAMKNLDTYCAANNIDKGSSEYYKMRAICQVIDDGEGEELLEDISIVSNRTEMEKYKLLLKHADVDMKIKTVRMDGKSIKARVYEILLDERALDRAEREYYEYLIESHTVKKLLEKYEEFFIGMLGEDAKHEDVRGLFVYWAQEAKQNVNNEGYTYTLKLTTKLFTSKMMEVSLLEEYEGENEEEEQKNGTEYIEIKCGKKGIGKSSKIEFVVDDVEYVYEVKANSESSFIAELSGDGFKFNFVFDKESQYFIIELLTTDSRGNRTESFYANGKLSVEKGKIELVSKEIRVRGEEVRSSFEIRICQEDEIPDVSHGPSD